MRARKAVSELFGVLNVTVPDPKGMIISGQFYSRSQIYKGRSWLSPRYPGNVEDSKVLIRADKVTIGHIIRESEQQKIRRLPTPPPGTHDAEVLNVGGEIFVTHPFADESWSGGPLYGIDEPTGQAYIIGVMSTHHVATVLDMNTKFAAAHHNGGPRLPKLLACARCTLEESSIECPKKK